jgi:ubiquinone/menaquinone biosynthesis C-methylase UbiE
MLLLHGSAAFQVLRAGVELGVFQHIHEHGPTSVMELGGALGLAPVGARTLMAGLAALGLTERDDSGRHGNAAAVQRLLEEGEWRVFSAMVAIQAHIMYPGQADYVDALRTGENVGARRFDGTGETLYQRIREDARLHAVFYEYMDAYSAYAIPHLLRAVRLDGVKRILDVGGGGGGNAIAFARAFTDCAVSLIDLPTTEPVARAKIADAGLEGRVRFVPGDMFEDAFPGEQDLVMFLHQLVIWSEEDNVRLLRKARQALRPGGSLLIFSSIADEHDGPLMAALDTVYFRAVAAGGGLIYNWRDYRRMLAASGFEPVQETRCGTWTPHGVLLARPV